MVPRFRATWAAAALATAHPPRLRHPNKLVVQSVACPAGAALGGDVTVTRWAAATPPDSWAPPKVRVLPGYFIYGNSAPGTTAWHQNFADPRLFGYYDTALFAQDEMQVAEHPVLASVPRAMEAAGERAYTEENGQPTPILVAGAERRVEVDTGPDLAPGRLSGLYGNRFGAASPDVVRSACRVIVPPTVSNIIAIAALSGGRGPYSPEELRHTLVTAYTGYRAAVLESAGTVEVHTGFWGCGAFGGHRVLMSALQIVAAGMAGVDTIVLHHGDASGKHPIHEAEQLVAGLSRDTTTMLAELDATRFFWGVSDGN